MPVLNERDYLRHAVDTVLAQDVAGPTELILALGPSTDGTTELARELALRDDRIVLIDNPAADIPIARLRPIGMSAPGFSTSTMRSSPAASFAASALVPSVEGPRARTSSVGPGTSCASTVSTARPR